MDGRVGKIDQREAKAVINFVIKILIKLSFKIVYY